LKVIEFGSDLGFVNWKDIGSILRQLIDRQRRIFGEKSEAGRRFREDQPEGLCRLRRDVAPLPEALLDQVSGLRQGKPGAPVERIKFLMTTILPPQSAGLDRR